MTKLETAKIIYRDKGSCSDTSIICENCPFDSATCFPGDFDKIKAWLFDNGFSKKDLVKPALYVKDAGSIIKWLDNNNYKVNSDGNWYRETYTVHFYAKMFYYCGMRCEDLSENQLTHCFGYWWLPAWLEEREE